MHEGGAPVATIYPGATLGPYDPYRGDQSERFRRQAAGRALEAATGRRQRFLLVPPGLLAALLQPMEALLPAKYGPR